MEACHRGGVERREDELRVTNGDAIDDAALAVEQQQTSLRALHHPGPGISRPQLRWYLEKA